MYFDRKDGLQQIKFNQNQMLSLAALKKLKPSQSSAVIEPLQNHEDELSVLRGDIREVKPRRRKFDEEEVNKLLRHSSQQCFM